MSINNITRSFAAMNTSSPKEVSSAVSPGGGVHVQDLRGPNPKIGLSPPDAGNTHADQYLHRRRHISEGGHHMSQVGSGGGGSSGVTIGSAAHNVVGGIFAMDSTIVPKGMSSSFGSGSAGVFDHDYQRKV